MPLVNLFHLAKSFVTDDTSQEVSYSTFLRSWHERWSRTLKFRSQNQHSKCNECEKFKAYRKLAVNLQDARAVSE
eukprot:255416-Alexandrium_andersonii.AAC.1